MTLRNVQFLNSKEFIHATTTVDGPVKTVFVSCPISNKVIVVQQDNTGNTTIIREIPITVGAMRAYGTSLATLVLIALAKDQVIVYNWNSDRITRLAEGGVNTEWMASDGTRALYSVGPELVLRTGLTGVELDRLFTFMPSVQGFIDETVTTEWLTLDSSTAFQYGTIDTVADKLILDYHGTLSHAKNVVGGYYRASTLHLGSQTEIRAYDLTDKLVPVLTTTRLGNDINDLIFHPDSVNTEVIASDEKDANSFLDFDYKREQASEIPAGVVMAHSRLPFVSKSLDPNFVSPVHLLYDGDHIKAALWTTTIGDMRDVNSEAAPNDRVYPHSNSVYMDGGNFAFSSGFRDVLNVPASTPFILSAWLGGFATQDDSAIAAVEWREADDTPISTDTLITVTEPDRGGVTGFLFRTVSGTTPSNVSYARVTISMTRVGFIVNDGYVDALTLEFGV